MQYLVKKGLTREECKKFKGTCLTPENFARVTFVEGDVISGDEYYVKKAVEMGAKAGEVIESEDSKKAKAEKKKAKAEAKKLADEEAAKVLAEKEAADLAAKENESN